nr:transposase [Skermanella stibiiresistens]
MPHKCNTDRRHHIPRPKWRVTNWAAYDEALRQRVGLTVWFTDEAITAWKAAPRTTLGGQPHYSDLAITIAQTLRAVFHLAPRQTEGCGHRWGGSLQIRGRRPSGHHVRAAWLRALSHKHGVRATRNIICLLQRLQEHKIFLLPARVAQKLLVRGLPSEGVTMPRSASLYTAQFVTRRFDCGMWWRRAALALCGMKAGSGASKQGAPYDIPSSLQHADPIPLI